MHAANASAANYFFSIISNIQRKHSFQLKTICLGYTARELYERLSKLKARKKR